MSPSPVTADNDAAAAQRQRPKLTNKRTHSASPIAVRPKSPDTRKIGGRRCQSVSPSIETAKISTKEKVIRPATKVTLAEGADALKTCSLSQTPSRTSENETDKEVILPQCLMSKMMRNLVTKKREFMKLRKNFIAQQNNFLESFAQLKELEMRAGVSQEEALGEVRVLSVTTWPAHDLLMLIRENLHVPGNKDVSGIFGPQILQQLSSQLSPIPEEMLSICAEVMARRIDLLAFMRTRHRGDRSTYLTNLEWKTRNTEFDAETERLHRMVAGSAENLKAKINFALEVASTKRALLVRINSQQNCLKKSDSNFEHQLLELINAEKENGIPWVDRESVVKKTERLQKENMLLQHRLDEILKKDGEDKTKPQLPEGISNYKELCDELTKERTAREALKDVVGAAESMLRVARARIATLERQLKDTRNELETGKKKQKELEQLYRHRENSYDTRSKKLLEISKNGEVTIESLSRQRDALEHRVKELREQTLAAENVAAMRAQEQRSCIDSLQAKVAEQEKAKEAAEKKVTELEVKAKDLEELLLAIRQRSDKLLDYDRRRCLDQVPTKETEPTQRETEIWKELQVTRAALARAEEEVQKSRADKDSFLDSLSRIAQGEPADSGDLQNKIAVELVEREQTIGKLHRIIEEQRQKLKAMEQDVVQYENKLAGLRLEIKRLRTYDCYSKEIPHEELQSEIVDLQMQVASLSRERKALVTAAASRALMLERHERSADLFVSMIRARKELAALLDGRSETLTFSDVTPTEISRSLSSVCANAADTWSALRAERARVLMLESAVLTQSLQLERESRVRTQMERRRASLEREVFRARLSRSPSPTISHSPMEDYQREICSRTSTFYK